MPSIVNRNASICRCGCGHKIDIETNRDVKFSAPNDHEFQGSTVNPCGEDFMMIKMPEGQLRYFTRALLVLGRSVLVQMGNAQQQICRDLRPLA
jgi:hypothetical protein